MRALLWTLLGLLLALGFVSLVTAEETTKPAEETEAKDTEAGADLDGGPLDLDGGVADGGETLEAPPPPPPPKTSPKVDESALPPAEPVARPFSKGSTEAALGLSLSGNGAENYLGVAGRYGYYLYDALAAGLDLRYTHIFVDKDAGYTFPDSLTLLPFVKYVLTRKSVAPYALVTGGYEWEWGAKNAANAWILGLGGGVHIAVSKHVLINLELTALHYWYNKTKTYWYDDDSLLRVDGDGGRKIFKADCKKSQNCGPLNDATAGNGDIVLIDSKGKKYLCTDKKLCQENAFRDKRDRAKEWFFPLISVGVGFVF